MASAVKPKSSRIKVRDHRERRPIRIWAPDVRAASFQAEAHRQALAVATSAHSLDDQSFIDAVSSIDIDDGGDE